MYYLMSIVFRGGWGKKTPHPFGWGVILSCICNISEESGVIVCRGFDPAFSVAVFDLDIHFSTGETAFQDLDFAAFFYGKDLFGAIGILEYRKFLCSIECPGVFAIRIDGFISSVGAFSLKVSPFGHVGEFDGAGACSPWHYIKLHLDSVSFDGNCFRAKMASVAFEHCGKICNFFPLTRRILVKTTYKAITVFTICIQEQIFSCSHAPFCLCYFSSFPFAFSSATSCGFTSLLLKIGRQSEWFLSPADFLII